MKRFVYLFIILSAIVFGAKSARAQEALSGAQMTFLDEVSYDFGEVERRGGDLIKVFRFQNNGDAPLVIKKVTKSCSCMTVNFSRKPIMPGEVDEIRMKYEPHKAEIGAFHKVVQVYTNTSQGVHLLTIQGKSLSVKRNK